MPSWDDPTVKWDDPLVGFNGGAPVARVPTWSDSISTWGDTGEGWNGESQSGDVQYGAPPGLYVKHPNTYGNLLQATIVTRGVPGQPANDLNLYLKIVLPPILITGDLDYVLYDLDSISPIPLVTTPQGGNGWTSVGSGDDGQVWAGTPAWFSTAGGSVYKRSGNTIWRILGPDRGTYAARARLENGPWVDAFHICGVPTTLNPTLPGGMYRVEPTTYAGYGPQAKNPTLERAFSDERPVYRMVAPAGSDIERSLSTSDRTIWRRADYPTLTFQYSGLSVTTFTVRSVPAGAKVIGYVKWTQAASPNYVVASFGPVADNTAVTTSMCQIIAMWDNSLTGSPVSSIGGWGSSWPMAAGYTLSVEPYTLVGAGTATDPFFQSAQYRALYSP